EGFLGGYPAWLDHVAPARLWDHPGTRELHALLLDQAIRGITGSFDGLVGVAVTSVVQTWDYRAGLRSWLIPELLAV
ncbi:hypothetical protein, partial [Enterobacter hormaechei]|uniref:hypothetical protein n=1 Tax=Enterobacter hormaechei TaxID=158836 RepID=UPI001952A46B